MMIYLTPAPKPLTDEQIIKKLRDKNLNLLSFYTEQSKKPFTGKVLEQLSNVNIKILHDVYAYKVIGKYSIDEIISEINHIKETLREYRNSFNVGQLVEDICVLSNIILKIKQIEWYMSHQPNELEEGYITVQQPIELHNKDSLIIEIESKVRESMSGISRILRDNNFPKEIAALIKKILTLGNKVFERYKIVKRSKTEYLLGAFYASSNTIVLYYDAIQNWLVEEPDLFKKILSVYAHEFFHAYHFALIENEKLWEYDEPSTIVKEGLADFIEYKYALVNIEKPAVLVSNHLTNWDKFTYEEYPYSAGQHYAKHDGLFEIIFKKSLVSPKRAFRIFFETVI